MIFGVLQTVGLAALLTIATAQCNGNLTNSSFVLNWIANRTFVRFTMSAPSNSNQYIAVGFTNSSDLVISEMDVIIAGDNGEGQSFVQDWWIEGDTRPHDMQQDLTQTSTSLSNRVLTASFTRPIVSSDEAQDVDLDVCRNVVWAYDGNVTSFTPYLIVSDPAKVGFFDDQICLPVNCTGSGTASLIASLTTLIISAVMFALI